ncbi:hypothetical protein [Parageobacillus sp. G301]|uniref:hypothetical protein n=1 Tax=Parageobacillus sp. G301 TaxID=2998290 RepID=UPI0024975284|nr:hypothetical protein [Parageobacillus sp. G301]GLH64221.1 hypothetical protein PG301_20600 [Parageobacillus sp. G301]
MISRIKPIIYAFALTLGVGLLSPLVDKAEAVVYWDGVELKPGQIGRLTVLKQTPLYKLEGSKKVFVRNLNPGQKFRIYAFKPGMLSMGGGYYVDRDNRVKYETPSKVKLNQVKQEQLMDGIHLGMNVSQVKTVAGKTGTLITQASDYGVTILGYKTRKFNSTVGAFYYFENNILTAVWYDFVGPEEEYLTPDQMKTLFYTLLDKVEPKIGQAGYIDEYNYDDDGYYGYSTVWKKANMNIILYVDDEDGYTAAGLVFEPIEE